MRGSDFDGLLKIASCLWLLASPLAACSSDDEASERDDAATSGDGDGDASTDASTDAGLDAGNPDAGPILTTFECQQAGGFPTADPGDGGCPGPGEPRGTISDFTGLALCCFVPPVLCAPQRVQIAGTCDGELSYYWFGTDCAAVRDCACEGPACGQGYPTEDECMASHAACGTILTRCGVVIDSTCPQGEYCFELSCSQSPNSTGFCVRTPTDCDDTVEPVCGCDGVTYNNSCELARSGTNARAYRECDQPAP